MHTIDVSSEPYVPIDPDTTESIELPLPSSPFGSRAAQVISNQADWSPPSPKTTSQEIGDRIVKLFTTAQARRELKRAYKLYPKRRRHYENLRA